MTKYADYEYIAEEIKDIDVGMLVLNAGWAIMGQFKIMEPSEIENIINTEALHPMYTLKTVLAQLLSRPKKACVIITGSGIGSAPIPGFIAHSMAKSFAQFMGQGLSIELKDKIDVLTFECGQVATKQNINDHSINPFSVNPERAVKGCLRDVGHTDYSYGPFVHDLLGSTAPKFIL